MELPIATIAVGYLTFSLRSGLHLLPCHVGVSATVGIAREMSAVEAFPRLYSNLLLEVQT
jgi:hypothetical protein